MPPPSHRATFEPRFNAYVGDDPMGLVIALNVDRRTLRKASAGVLAARLGNMPPWGDRLHQSSVNYGKSPDF